MPTIIFDWDRDSTRTRTSRLSEGTGTSTVDGDGDGDSGWDVDATATSASVEGDYTTMTLCDPDIYGPTGDVEDCLKLTYTVPTELLQGESTAVGVKIVTDGEEGWVRRGAVPEGFEEREVKIERGGVGEEVGDGMKKVSFLV